jgi:peptide/nickel transport system permease protein
MRYTLRRLGFYLLTTVVAISINFLVPHLMPGNPAEILVANFRGRVSPAAIRSVSALFGLSHASLWSQYLTYWRQLFHGNLGISFSFYPSTVWSVIARSLPWTIWLVGSSTIISFVLGTLLGIIVAWRRGSWLDSTIPLTTFFSAVPYFWFGLVVVFVFGSLLKWFPLYGGYNSSTSIGWSWSFIQSAFYYSILPATTIVLSSIAGWLLGMRNMMITTVGEDYIVLAEAEGLTERRIMLAYAARNAILPNIADFALSLGFVVSGAILTEIVFSYPGIGYILYEAVDNEDFPLMQGIFLVITLAVLAANLLADLSYGALDPRTRQGA